MVYVIQFWYLVSIPIRNKYTSQLTKVYILSSLLCINFVYSNAYFSRTEAGLPGILSSTWPYSLTLFPLLLCTWCIYLSPVVLVNPPLWFLDLVPRQCSVNVMQISNIIVWEKGSRPSLQWRVVQFRKSPQRRKQEISQSYLRARGLWAATIFFLT